MNQERTSGSDPLGSATNRPSTHSEGTSQGGQGMGSSASMSSGSMSSGGMSSGTGSPYASPQTSGSAAQGSSQGGSSFGGSSSAQGGSSFGDSMSSAGQGARTAASDTMQQAREKAQGLVGQAKDQVTQQLSGQKERAASTLGSLAGAIRQTGEQLQSSEQHGAAGIAEQVAQGIERFSGYLNERSVTDLLSEVESYARREPALFIGGAFLLGIAASRFLKASAPRQEAHYASASNYRASYGAPHQGGYGGGYEGSGYGRGYQGGSYSSRPVYGRQQAQRPGVYSDPSGGYPSERHTSAYSSETHTSIGSDPAGNPSGGKL